MAQLHGGKRMMMWSILTFIWFGGIVVAIDRDLMSLPVILLCILSGIWVLGRLIAASREEGE